MVERRTWREFRRAGLLWWVNRILHVFGWAIVVAVEQHDEDDVVEVYPARVRYRGFDEKTEALEHRKLTAWMDEHSEDLLAEASMD